MKKALSVSLCYCLLFASVAFAQSNGYQINVQINPLKKTWVYLGYHYGHLMPINDSAFLDEQGKGLFKGDKPLPEGIYLIATSKSRLLFELLIGKKQQFTIISDTSTPDQKTKFINSPENEQFRLYTNYITPRGKAIEELRNKISKATDQKEKVVLQQIIDKNANEIDVYRKKFIKQQPSSLLAMIFSSMQEISLPDKYKKPATFKDTLEAFYYTKQHYWDGVNFMDGRIIRTPIFERKLKAYFDNYVAPTADSIIQEINWMMALGRNDKDMFQFLIGYFVDNYYAPKIMGQDKVFLHLYQRYFATKQVTWLNEKQIKQITDRAYMIMANQIGDPAAELNLVDTAGKFQRLYDLSANYTVVAFWDPDCGHCQTEIPKLDSIYESKWKSQNVKIYAVMVNELSLEKWGKFINEHAPGWIHVHQTNEMKAEEEKAKQPNYHQLYDIRTTPSLFLLDKEKRIIAKSVSLEDLDKLLQEKIKQSSQQ